MNIVCAIVLKGNMVLIQRRIRKGALVYEFPMGKLELNESPENGAIRELEEETGLNAKLENRKTVLLNNETGDSIYFVFLKTSENENPRMVDSRRQQTFYWMEFDEIPLEDFYKPDCDFINMMSLAMKKSNHST